MKDNNSYNFTLFSKLQEFNLVKLWLIALFVLLISLLFLITPLGGLQILTSDFIVTQVLSIVGLLLGIIASIVLSQFLLKDDRQYNLKNRLEYSAIFTGLVILILLSSILLFSPHFFTLIPSAVLSSISFFSIIVVSYFFNKPLVNHQKILNNAALSKNSNLSANNTAILAAQVLGSMLSLSALVISVLLFLGMLSFFSTPVNNLTLAGVLFIMGLFTLKSLIEKSRQPQTINEINGFKPASRRVTWGRFMIWTLNITFLGLMLVIGFLSGITSTLFLDILLFTAAWYSSQLLLMAQNTTTALSTTVEKKKEEKQEEKQEDETKLINKGNESQQINQNSLSCLVIPNEKKQKPTVVEEKNIYYIPHQPYSTLSRDIPEALHQHQGKKNNLRSYSDDYALLEVIKSDMLDVFKVEPFDVNNHLWIPLGDFAARAYFVSAVVMGIFLGPMTNFIYLNLIYNSCWNYVDGATALPGIYANWQQNNTMLEKFLYTFELIVAIFLIVSTIISQTMQSGVYATLGAYGFAWSMIASAIRALKDTYSAWVALSPRFLLVQRLAAIQTLTLNFKNIENKINKSSDERILENQYQRNNKQLLYEVTALIGCLKSQGMFETDEEIKILCQKYLGDLTQTEWEDIQTYQPTREQTQFVSTLLSIHKEKFLLSFFNLCGFIAAAVCFTLLALNPLVPPGISLMHSFGGGILLFFVASGAIKIFQIGLNIFLFAYKKYHLRSIVNKYLKFSSNSYEYISKTYSTDSITWQEFFKQEKISTKSERYKYFLAYYYYVSTQENGIDIASFTKLLRMQKGSFLTNMLGIDNLHKILDAAIENTISNPLTISNNNHDHFPNNWQPTHSASLRQEQLLQNRFSFDCNQCKPKNNSSFYSQITSTSSKKKHLAKKF